VSCQAYVVAPTLRARQRPFHVKQWRARRLGALWIAAARSRRGSLCVIAGRWFTAHGSRLTAHGSRLTAHGSRLTIRRFHHAARRLLSAGLRHVGSLLTRSRPPQPRGLSHEVASAAVATPASGPETPDLRDLGPLRRPLCSPWRVFHVKHPNFSVFSTRGASADGFDQVAPRAIGASLRGLAWSGSLPCRQRQDGGMTRTDARSDACAALRVWVGNVGVWLGRAPVAADDAHGTLDFSQYASSPSPSGRLRCACCFT